MNVRTSLASALFASALPSLAAAQGVPMEVAAPQVVVAPARGAYAEREEGPVRIRLDEGERAGAQALLWGPGGHPATCTLPCMLGGQFGQYGVTVARGGSAYQTGFVLEPGQSTVRVRLRGPSGGRLAGAVVLITFGVMATGVGLGFMLTGAALSGSYYGGGGTAVIFALVIGLPLLAAGVPMLAGGIVLANTSGPAATVRSGAELGAWLDRPSLRPLAQDTGALTMPLYGLRF